MAMNTEAQMCSALKQLLKEPDEDLELEVINMLEVYLSIGTQQILSENDELTSLLYEVASKSDRMKLYCLQYNFMQGEKTGLKAMSSMTNFLCNPMGTKGVEKVMTGLLKVSYDLNIRGGQKIFFLLSLFLFLLPGISSQHLPSTVVSINKDHIILNSEIRMTELYEITEKIKIEPLVEFLNQLNNTLKHIEEFTEFKESHTACAVYGNANDNTDNFENIEKIARERKISNLLVQHQEQSRNHNFMTLFRMLNGSFSCEISYSLSRIQLLLSLNTRRSAPYYKHEKYAYRDALYSLFQDKNGLKCLRHGLIKENGIFPYDLKVYVEEPGVEKCQQICTTMRKRFNQGLSINRLTGVKLDFNDCGVWSFSIANKTCFIKHKIDQNMFLNKMSHSSEYEFMSVSGKPDCQVKLDVGFPSIYVNNKLTDMRSICSFSNNNLIFTKYNARCMNLYFSIKQPLQKLKLEMGFFIKSFLRNNILKNRPVKRSIGSLFGKVATFLSHAVAREGVSFLSNVVQKASLQPLEILTSINNNMRQAGYEGRIVKKVKRRQQNIDILQFMEGFKILQQVTNKIVNKNFNVILEGLAQNGTRLMEFFENLIHSDAPMFNSTLDFIQNSSYLYSSYVIPGNGMVIRHFLKPVIKEKYKSNMISYIPINKDFFNKNFWQTDTFVGSEQETPNSCLIQLLAGNLNEQIHNKCQYAKSSKLIKNDNIYFIRHTFGEIVGKVVLINQPGLVEISCKEGSLMEKTMGLIVLAISEDCKVLLNGIQVFNSKSEAVGFPPKLILRYNETIQQIVEHKFGYIDEVQFIIMGVILLIFLMLIGFQKCVKVQKPLEEGNEQIQEYELVEKEAMVACVD